MGLRFRVPAKALARCLSVRVRGETVPSRHLENIDFGVRGWGENQGGGLKVEGPEFRAPAKALACPLSV